MLHGEEGPIESICDALLMSTESHNLIGLWSMPGG